MDNNIIIIDYGSGNLRSAQKAFEHVGKGVVKLSSDPADLKLATHIVLPGVGAFGDCARGLRAIDGMIEALEEEVLQKRKPFLGICVGMQLLADIGMEHGEHEGLGWIPGKVQKIKPKDKSLAIPHMGWNSLKLTKNQSILGKMDDDVYFVHSYQFVCDDEYVVATAEYGGAINAIVAKDNIIGVQFHPEKSQKAGLELISNFLEMQNE